MNTKNLGINSKLIHAGQEPDATGAVTVPIYQTSTFSFRNAEHGAALFAGSDDGYIYTRIGNPTIAALENAVAELEGGFGGVATSSGMAAVCSVYLALLNAGDHMVSTASVYGPSRGLMEKDFSRFGVQSTYVDTCNLEEVQQALRPQHQAGVPGIAGQPDDAGNRHRGRRENRA
jgi:methionine-gamma-lyase